MPVGRLHVITTRKFQTRFSHVELASLAIDGGADVIQFRDKEISKGQTYTLAKEISDIGLAASTKFLINDHVDLALLLENDGVHLGKNDLPVELARRLLGKNKIIGATANSIEDAKAMESGGANYLGVGPIFSGDSKAKNLEVLGLEKFKTICESVDIPVIGIGGINIENAASVLEFGGHGIAVMTRICCAEDPTAATAMFLSQIS